MIDIVRILLAILTAYRLSSLITEEEGPYLGLWNSPQQIGLFEWVRLKLGAYDYGPDGQIESNLARGISCSLCVGVYVAAFIVALILFPTKMGDAFLIWMGLAGGQRFLEIFTGEN